MLHALVGHTGEALSGVAGGSEQLPSPPIVTGGLASEWWSSSVLAVVVVVVFRCDLLVAPSTTAGKSRPASSANAAIKDRFKHSTVEHDQAAEVA